LALDGSFFDNFETFFPGYRIKIMGDNHVGIFQASTCFGTKSEFLRSLQKKRKIEFIYSGNRDSGKDKKKPLTSDIVC